MPLEFPSPPADGSSALYSGLQQIVQARGATVGGGAALAAANSQPVQPHPIYELGLSDLIQGKSVDSARKVGWRYLLVENGQAVVQAAEVFAPPGGGASQFGSLTNAYTKGVEAAFERAEQLAEVQNGRYEIRAVRVPALYVMALWLKDLAGSQDRFIALPPAFPPLQTQATYSTGDFMTLLRTSAQEKARLESNVQYPAAAPPQSQRGQTGQAGFQAGNP